MELDHTRDNQTRPDSSRDCDHRPEEETPQKPRGKEAYLLNLQRENRIIKRNKRIIEVMG